MDPLHFALLMCKLQMIRNESAVQVALKALKQAAC
jgi:hypothetical protein